MPTLASDGIHWSSHDLMTRNAMWMYAIGGRGVGKTYEMKVKGVRRFLSKGKQFIYMRRYETEFADREQLFDDIADVFPDHEIRVHGMRAQVRPAYDEVDEQGNPEKNPHPWRTCCYLVALSTTVGKKSVPYPNVDLIVFDEFIIDRGFIHYIPNEVRIFLEFYNTVDRFTDRVRVMFLANAISIVNPYFVYFRITPRIGQRFCSAMKGFHCCEMIESTAYAERVTSTRFGSMIAETEYYDYAVGNRFTLDESPFMEAKSAEARYQFSVVFDGVTLGMWRDFKRNLWYVTQKTPSDARPYVLTRADQTPDMLMVERSSGLLKGMKRMYMTGQVRFDTPQVKATWDNVMRYLNLV